MVAEGRRTARKKVIQRAPGYGDQSRNVTKLGATGERRRRKRKQTPAVLLFCRGAADAVLQRAPPARGNDSSRVCLSAADISAAAGFVTLWPGDAIGKWKRRGFLYFFFPDQYLPGVGENRSYETDSDFSGLFSGVLFIRMGLSVWVNDLRS